MKNDILIYLGFEVERRKAAYSETAKRYGTIDIASSNAFNQLLEAQRIKQALELIIAQYEKEDVQ